MVPDSMLNQQQSNLVQASQVATLTWHLLHYLGPIFSNFSGSGNFKVVYLRVVLVLSSSIKLCPKRRGLALLEMPC